MRLPIDELLPRIRDLCKEGNVVLRAPTGAGKTTRVPGALLDHGPVIMVEPRRLAARAAARRIAEELGDAVGYHVRFDKQAGPRTKLLVCTEGILLRRLQEDPLLESTAVVVFDEFHERNLASDLALALLRRAQREVRPELRLVAMSATAATGPVAAFLDAPVVESEGRSYPVDIVHAPGEAPAAVRRALDETDGDVLAFFPGVGEIRRAKEQLTGVDVHELYGDLPPDRQDAALLAGARRRVVLATNVAETSVTVEGVTAVVDTGYARVPRYDPGCGLQRLELQRISQASADQRAGRAGRLRPGVCYRLWPAHERLDAQDLPEVRRADLAGAVLTLLAAGEPDVFAFPWFEAPEPDRLARACATLESLGATADGRITDVGRRMARQPVQPRLARLLVEGERRGQPRRAALAAALLSERDIFPRGPARHRSDSDVLDRVEAAERGRVPRFVKRAADQLARGRRDDVTGDEPLLRALAAAFADRLARRRAPGDPRGVMVGGRGVRLAEDSAVAEPELFVCVVMDGGRRGERSEGRVRIASRVEREWLTGTTEETVVHFDAGRESVVAERQVRFRDLVLARTPAPLPPDAGDVLLAAAAAFECPELPWLVRLRFLREHMPELDLPDLDARDVLPELCAGRRSFEELRKAPWLQSLKGRLRYEQLQLIEKYAPERIGKHKLEYEGGRPPVLAARIQELFGVTETPTVAGGRVRVLLHLLAPNRRPQQITDDLASFWKNTYPRVRKELRARYPKHRWPENPG